MVGLAVDEAAEVNDNTLGFVALTRKVGVGMLELRNFLLVPLALSLKLFGNFLLKNESLEGIITLLLSARKTESKTSNVVLLLVDEGGETAVFTLVVLNLDLEFRGFFGELLSERLEFEELQRGSAESGCRRARVRQTCCFHVSSSSTRKLLRFVTFDSSVSILPLRLIKSCQASRASLEYWLRSRTISLRCLMDTLVISGFLTEPPKMALRPVLRPYKI